MTTMQVFPAPGAITAALDRLPADGSPAVLQLAPGVYREPVVIRRPHTALEGESPENTRIVWADGARDLLPDGTRRGTFRTATVRVDGEAVTLRRLTVENGAGPRETCGQAIALYADGDGFLCEDCVLLGWQDTLFTAPLPPKEIEPGGFVGPKQFAPRVPQRQRYLRCTIRGDVDFIFGSAAAWFEDCDIVTADGRQDRTAPFTAWCTAASTPEGQAMGYVFYHCRFTAEPDVPAGSTWLGRPWREYAKTVLIDCDLGPHIHPAHWHDWGKEAFHHLGYYAATTPAAQAPSWAHVLTEAERGLYTQENFMRLALSDTRR